MSTTLLVTDRLEPTADLLIAELRRRGVPCVRWNLDQFPFGSALTYHASGVGFGTTVVTDGRRVNLDNIRSIWCRGFQPTGFPADMEPTEKEFAETEARRALAGLMTVANVVWINHPHYQTLANSKPAQIFTARRVGLDIPRTLVTNDPGEVRSFVAKSEGQVIYKTLSQSLKLESGKALFTGLLTERELAKVDLIRLSPGIFQEWVPKAYEVRATVVGRRIFAVKIGSQAHQETTLDWRHAPFDLEYKPIDLPRDVQAKIHSLMEIFHLVYGALDLIVTPEGRWVFLEINPAGQYMWVESKTGLGITSALADALTDPCST